MTSCTPGRPEPEPNDHTELDAQMSRLDRRVKRIRDEIERNRAGGHKVPTWVLALLLLLVVGAWFVLVTTA